MSDGAEWVAVDWGTSHLRAHVIGPEGRVLARPASDAGMATLERDGFEPALAALLAPWLDGAGPLQVIACGMVGSRHGWVEAPYAAVPCPPLDAARMVRAPARDPRLSVQVIPGLRQNTPPDVMRGEETQIAGFLAAEPGFDGVLCLPGTHSKWARISAGEVVSFQTYLTGELFDLLATRSVLRHTLARDGGDEGAFLAAVADALSHPARFGAALFGLRAGALIAGLAPEAARARLSGLVIGLELGGARPYWLGQRVALAGAPALTALYAAALAAQGVAASRHDGAEMVLAGLATARAALREVAR